MYIYISNLNISFSVVPHVLCRPDMVNFVLGHADFLSTFTNQVPRIGSESTINIYVFACCDVGNSCRMRPEDIHRLKWKCQQALRYGQTKLKTGHWLANFLLPLLDIHWHFLSNFKLHYSTAALYIYTYTMQACWPLPFTQNHPF